MNVQTAVSETEIMEPLSIEDRSLLITLEDQIAKGRDTAETSVREVGEALFQIHEQHLYRGEFKTFEAYVRGKWDISRQRAYQLLEARQTFRLLVNRVDIRTEKAARELSGLSDEEKLVAGDILAKSGKKVTTKAARKAAAKVSPEKAEKEKARQARVDAKAEKDAEKIKAKREKAEAKALAKSEKTRLARETKEAKQTEKEKNAAAIKRTWPSVSQRPARGGLFKSKQEAETGATQKPAQTPANRVRGWWKANGDVMGKWNVDLVVKAIIKFLEAP